MKAKEATKLAKAITEWLFNEHGEFKYATDREIDAITEGQKAFLSIVNKSKRG